jgi:hypothetical protein
MGSDGPMDLLLDLAERQRIDLGRLSILALVQRFVAELDGRLRAVAIEQRADWVVVAARLTQLRSRLLLPADPAAADAAERDAARVLAGLEEMRFIRTAASRLQTRPQLDQEVFAWPHGRSLRVASYMALMEACLTVIQGGPSVRRRKRQKSIGSRRAIYGGWAMRGRGSATRWRRCRTAVRRWVSYLICRRRRIAPCT